MATGTKIRILSRLLDSSTAPLWAIGPTGRIVYLSAACAQWLGVDIERLVDRLSVAGSPLTDDPYDQVAASLSPPPGLASRGTTSLRVQPPTVGENKPAATEVRFVRVGNDDQSLTIAVAGDFDDRSFDPELQDAVALRQRLDAWRKQHAKMTNIATAGTTLAARRTRRRLQVAASTRADIGFFGPPGCGSESIAARVHQLSTQDEPIVTVDGPLMDPELLDATLTPLVHRLNDSPKSCATALVRSLDEMPLEAQQQLAATHEVFAGRLRLLGLVRISASVLISPIAESPRAPEPSAIDEAATSGICGALAEILDALSVVIEPLASRVADIPVMAAALLDARRAKGDTVAERFNRAALDAFVLYPWPRDFEELCLAVDYAARRSTGSSVGVESLPLAVRSYRPGEKPGQNPADPSQIGSGQFGITSLDDAVARYELRLINQAVEAADGNRAAAARQLGISRARLLRKIADAAKTE